MTQSSSLENPRKIYPGLDLLKFVMSLMVVAIHVKPFETAPGLLRTFKPCLDAAVPTFFLISSFLLFRKVNLGTHEGGENHWKTIARFAKRIGLLYLVWFIIDSPYIITKKGYFNATSFADSFTCLIKDFIFGSTFPGSWFLSALVISVVLVYGSSRFIGKWGTFFIALVISFYVLGQDLIPKSLQGLYEWYANNIRDEVDCSFPFALVWVSMGQVLSSQPFLRCIESSKHCSVILWLFFFFLYVVMVLSGSPFFLNYLLVPVLFVVCLNVIHSDSLVYKKLRNASILIFFFHFSIAGKKNLFLNYFSLSGFGWHVCYYSLVIAISLCFAFVVLHLEDKKYFHFLRYTH